MESKLLAGGKNIVDRTDDAKRALDKKRQEVIEQKVDSSETLLKKISCWATDVCVHVGMGGWLCVGW